MRAIKFDTPELNKARVKEKPIDVVLFEKNNWHDFEIQTCQTSQLSFFTDILFTDPSSYILLLPL